MSIQAPRTRGLWVGFLFQRESRVHLCHVKSNLSWSDLFRVSFDGVECSVTHLNYYRSFGKRSPLLFKSFPIWAPSGGLFKIRFSTGFFPYRLDSISKGLLLQRSLCSHLERERQTDRPVYRDRQREAAATPGKAHLAAKWSACARGQYCLMGLNGGIGTEKLSSIYF